MKIEVTFPELHPAQKVVRDCDSRFIVLSAGRRWGKTMLGTLLCMSYGLQGKRAWWIAPSYAISEVGWRPLRKFAAQIPFASINKVERIIRYPGGGEVRVRSADDPQSLRGEGLDFVVFDEASYTKKEAWTEAVRPALADRNGRALFISTPRGRNWLYDLFRLGESGEPGWASFRFPTSSNPHIPPEEIEAARRDLPEIIFRQEFLAEFVDSNGAVFRKVHDAISTDIPTERLPERQYIIGVDVASSNDYTVVVVMDDMRRVVFIDRFNRTEYPVLADRIAAISQMWKPERVIVESNAMGAAVVDMLAERGVPVMGFTTTQASKIAIVQSLALAFETGQITIPNHPVLIGELLSFEGKRNPLGTMSYSAPDGMHDDCVMALCITNYFCQQATQPAAVALF